MDLDYLKDVGLRIFRVLGLVGLTEKNFNSLYAPGKAYRNFKFLQGTPITDPATQSSSVVPELPLGATGPLESKP